MGGNPGGDERDAFHPKCCHICSFLFFSGTCGGIDIRPYSCPFNIMIVVVAIVVVAAAVIIYIFIKRYFYIILFFTIFWHIHVACRLNSISII